MASRDTQDEVQEWIMKVERLAKAEGGHLEWRTQRLSPGGLPGMSGPGVGPWLVHTLRCHYGAAAAAALSEAA
eukprot:5855029-Lingulodinium_polyedra.AAC.1